MNSTQYSSNKQYIKPLKYMKLIDCLCKNLNVKRVVFSGGEPTLISNLEDILKYAKDKGLEIVLCSNGYNFEGYRFNSISPYVDKMSFSLHGTQTTHNFIVNQKGAYNNVIESIKKSIHYGLYTSILTCILSINLPILMETISRVHEMNVNEHVIFPVVPLGRAKSNTSLLLDKGETTFLQEKITDIHNHYPNVYFANWGNWGMFTVDLGGIVSTYNYFKGVKVEIGNIFEKNILTRMNMYRDMDLHYEIYKDVRGK